MKNDTLPVDARNVILRKGDRVAYPARRSSSCFLRYGTIDRIDSRGICAIIGDETGKENYRFHRHTVKL